MEKRLLFEGTKKNSTNFTIEGVVERLNKRREYLNKLDSEIFINIEYKDYEGN